MAVYWFSFKDNFTWKINKKAYQAFPCDPWFICSLCFILTPTGLPEIAKISPVYVIFFSLTKSKLLWALFIVASQYSGEQSRGYVSPSLFLKPSEEQINLFANVTKGSSGRGRNKLLSQKHLLILALTSKMQ